MRATITRPDGATLVIEGDDPEQLGVLLASYERASKKPTQIEPEETVQPAPSAPAHAWPDFCAHILTKPDQLRVLSAVKDLGFLSLEDLREILGVESTLDVGGVVGAIRRKTLKFGFQSTDDILLRDDRSYRPGPVLKANDLPRPATPVPTRHRRIISMEDE